MLPMSVTIAILKAACGAAELTPVAMSAERSDGDDAHDASRCELALLHVPSLMSISAAKLRRRI